MNRTAEFFSSKTYLCILVILYLLFATDFQSPVQAAAPQLKAGAPLTIDDFPLKGVQLGESINTVQLRLGLPKSKTQGADGISYDYGDIELIVSNRDAINNVRTNKKTVSTRRGIHPGSLLAEIKQAYGESYQKTEIGELDLYEYTISPSSKTKYFLRFAVNRSSNVVNFIECRDETEIPLAAVRLDGKFGYIDTTGQVVIAPQYNLAWEFSHGLAEIDLNGKSGYIDTKGNIVIEPQYNSLGSFSEGLVGVEINGKYGYMDKQETLVVPPVYDLAFRFCQGLALVKINGKFGYIDTTGRMVIEPKYQFAYSFTEGLAAVMIDGKYGYIDTNGNMVIAPQFEDSHNIPLPVSNFSQGLAAVKINDKCGYIDTKGNIVVEPQFSWAMDFSQGLAMVIDKANGKIGYIDTSGNMVIAFQLSEASYLGEFSEGLASLVIEDKLGFINASGIMVIEPQYGNTRRGVVFSQGLAAVKVNGKYGYINTKGDMVIMPQFEIAERFSVD